MGALLGIKGILVLILVAIIAVSVAVCFRACKPPRPPRIVTRDYTVVAVPNGATITVQAGLLGRKTATVTLQYVAAAEGVYAEPSRQALETRAGKTIRVEDEKRRLLSAEREDSEDLEARGPIVGVVYGETGALLNLAQISDGWATCTEGAPKEYAAAEKAAKKAKVGMWAK